jgi:hypothetical protein
VLPARLYAPAEDDELELRHRYAEVWNAGGIDGLVGLLREDAVIRMPPQPSVVGALATATFLPGVAAPFSHVPEATHALRCLLTRAPLVRRRTGRNA